MQTRRLRRVAEHALARYDLRPVRVRRMPRGWNATFGVLADDGARYALRVHRPGGPDAAMVRSELDWLTSLGEATDLRMPRPRPTRDGDLVVVVQDPDLVGDDRGRACDLLGWVEGHFVDVGLTPTHLRAMGSLVARLQGHGRVFVRPAGFVRPDVTGWSALARADQDPLGPDLVDRALAALRALDAGWDLGVVFATLERARATRDDAVASGRRGLLHADVHHENVLFATRTPRRGEPLQVGAIDFDDCGDGPDSYDLAVMVTEMWRRADRQALRAALLEGYAEVRPLPGGSAEAVDEQVDAMEGLRHLQLAVYAVDHRDEEMFATWQREDMTEVIGRLAGLLDRRP